MNLIDSRMRYDERRVYAFSNENLTSFQNIYKFDGASVLTVLGSGDQYFASKLFGAKHVEVFDCNPNSWAFFVLKFYAIRILSYEEFQFLLKSNFSTPHLISKIMPYVPHDVLVELRKIIKETDAVLQTLIYSPLSDYYENFNTGRTIPYLDKENYYTLQNILRNSTLPKMYFKNLMDMPKALDGTAHDILLASNVFKWLIMTPKDYDEFLSKFKVQIIQAYYFWHQSNEMEDIESLGYQSDSVRPANPYDQEKNFVISKIRH